MYGGVKVLNGTANNYIKQTHNAEGAAIFQYAS